MTRGTSNAFRVRSLGCAYPNPSDVPYVVKLSDGRAVVITLGMRPAELIWIPGGCCGAATFRGIMLERAQQECGHYGKDAVFVREEPAYSYTRYHYRCETRKVE